MITGEENRHDGLALFLRALLRSRAAAEAPALLRILLGMRDPHRCASYLGNWLSGLTPEAIVSVLDALLEETERKEPGAEQSLQAMMSPELRSTWETGLSYRVQAVARREGRFDLAAILLELPEMDERFAPPAGRLPKKLEDVPLGVRKSWARRTDIYLMEHLLSDPDRAVIANLLDNPRLTLQEVVRLASQAKASGEILEEIALHPRWIPQYRVKVTLAYNPSTPMRITLGLLRLLMDQDLEKIARDSRLSEVVLKRARGMLRERKERREIAGS
jgi:hypothetical protein